MSNKKSLFDKLTQVVVWLMLGITAVSAAVPLATVVSANADTETASTVSSSNQSDAKSTTSDSSNSSNSTGKDSDSSDTSKETNQANAPNNIERVTDMVKEAYSKPDSEDLELATNKDSLEAADKVSDDSGKIESKNVTLTVPTSEKEVKSDVSKISKESAVGMTDEEATDLVSSLKDSGATGYDSLTVMLWNVKNLQSHQAKGSNDWTAWVKQLKKEAGWDTWSKEQQDLFLSGNVPLTTSYVTDKTFVEGSSASSAFRLLLYIYSGLYVKYIPVEQRKEIFNADGVDKFKDVEYVDLKSDITAYEAAEKAQNDKKGVEAILTELVKVKSLPSDVIDGFNSDLKEMKASKSTTAGTIAGVAEAIVGVTKADAATDMNDWTSGNNWVLDSNGQTFTFTGSSVSSNTFNSAAGNGFVLAPDGLWYPSFCIAKNYDSGMTNVKLGPMFSHTGAANNFSPNYMTSLSKDNQVKLNNMMYSAMIVAGVMHASGNSGSTTAGLNPNAMDSIATSFWSSKLANQVDADPTTLAFWNQDGTVEGGWVAQNFDKVKAYYDKLDNSTPTTNQSKDMTITKGVDDAGKDTGIAWPSGVIVPTQSSDGSYSIYQNNGHIWVKPLKPTGKVTTTVINVPAASGLVEGTTPFVYYDASGSGQYRASYVGFLANSNPYTITLNIKVNGFVGADLQKTVTLNGKDMTLAEASELGVDVTDAEYSIKQSNGSAPTAAQLASMKLTKGTAVSAATFSPDKDGMISFNSVMYGDYYLIETKAPDGVKLDTTKYNFGATAANTDGPDSTGNFITNLKGANGSHDALTTFGFNVSKQITANDANPNSGAGALGNHSQFDDSQETSIETDKVDLTKTEFALQYHTSGTILNADGTTRTVSVGSPVLATDMVVTLFLNDAKDGVNSDLSGLLKYGTLEINENKEIVFHPTKDGKLEAHNLYAINGIKSLQLVETATPEHTTISKKVIVINAFGSNKTDFANEAGDIDNHNAANGFQNDIELTGINLKKQENYLGTIDPTGTLGETNQAGAEYTLYSNEGDDKDQPIQVGDYRVSKLTNSSDTHMSTTGSVVFTTDANGNVANIDDVIYGSYYLLETKAGVGLHLDKTKYYFGTGSAELNGSHGTNTSTAGVSDTQSEKTHTTATSNDDTKLISVELEKRGLWTNVASPWKNVTFDSDTGTTSTSFGDVTKSYYTNSDTSNGDPDVGSARRSGAVYELIYAADSTDGKHKAGTNVEVDSDVVANMTVTKGKQVKDNRTVGKINADGTKYVYFETSDDGASDIYGRIQVTNLAYQAYALREVISPAGMQIDNNYYYFGAGMQNDETYVGNGSSTKLDEIETQTASNISTLDTHGNYVFDHTFDNGSYGSTDNLLTFGFSAVKVAEQDDDTQMSVGENGVEVILTPVGGQTESVPVGKGSSGMYATGSTAQAQLPDGTISTTLGKDISTKSKTYLLPNGTNQSGYFEFRTVPVGAYIMHTSGSDAALLEIEDLLVVYGRSKDGHGYTLQIGLVDHSVVDGKDTYKIKGTPLYSFDSDATNGATSGIPSQAYWNNNSGVDLTSTTNNIVNNEIFEDLASQNFSVVDKPSTNENKPTNELVIGTEASNADGGTKILKPNDKQVIKDRIFITDFRTRWKTGEKLTVTATVMDKETNSKVVSQQFEVKYDSNQIAIDPNTNQELPYVDIEIPVDASALAGKSLVMFEDVYNNDTTYTDIQHPEAETDINNTNQTVTVSGGPSIDIEKANGGTPNAGNGNNTDKDNNAGPGDHDTIETAYEIPNGSSTDIHFRFTNNGTEDLTKLVVTDKTIEGSVDVKDIVWTYKDQVLTTNTDGQLTLADGTLLVLPVGESVIGKGTLPAVPSGTTHGDEVTVVGFGVDSGTKVSDKDKWYGKGQTPEISTQAMIDNKESNTFTPGNETNVGDIIHITNLTPGTKGKNNIKLWLVPGGDTSKATVVYEDSHDITAEGTSYEDLVNTVYDTSSMKKGDYLVWTEVFEGTDADGNPVVAKHEDLTNKKQTLTPVFDQNAAYSQTGLASFGVVTVIGVGGLIGYAWYVIKKRKQV